MSESTLFRAISILGIFDKSKAREFYVDFLGFKVDWEHRFEPHLPLDMQISRGRLVLHLSDHHGDVTPGSTVLVQTTAGLELLHAELLAKNCKHARPRLEIAPGRRE